MGAIFLIEPISSKIAFTASWRFSNLLPKLLPRERYILWFVLMNLFLVD